MAARDFLETVNRHISDLGANQLPQIQRAGALIADAISAGHRIWMAQTSHCLHGEATYRAGGFMAAHILENPVVIEPGDIVIEGTPAGTSKLAIDIAVDVKERGATLIALTQRVFEDDPRILLQHPHRLRLSELADIVIDLGGSYGDGEFDLLDSGVRILPTSGITAMVAMWMMFAEAVDIMTGRGEVPLMWQSMLVPGAIERNEELRAEYHRTRVGFVPASESV